MEMWGGSERDSRRRQRGSVVLPQAVGCGRAEASCRPPRKHGTRQAVEKKSGAVAYCHLCQYTARATFGARRDCWPVTARRKAWAALCTLPFVRRQRSRGCSDAILTTHPVKLTLSIGVRHSVAAADGTAICEIKGAGALPSCAPSPWPDFVGDSPAGSDWVHSSKFIPGCSHFTCRCAPRL